MIDVALRTLVAQHAQVGENVLPSTEVGDVANVLPKVVYTLIGSPRFHTNDGPVRVVTARYQLDVYAGIADEARAIATRVRSPLDGARPGTVAGVPVLLVRFGDDNFAGTAPAPNANTAAAKFSTDVFVTYRE